MFKTALEFFENWKVKSDHLAVSSGGTLRIEDCSARELVGQYDSYS